MQAWPWLGCKRCRLQLHFELDVMQAEMAHAEDDWWQDQIFQVPFLFVQASKLKRHCNAEA
mgnify:CR=1 FL=1